MICFLLVVRSLGDLHTLVCSEGLRSGVCQTEIGALSLVFLFVRGIWTYPNLVSKSTWESLSLELLPTTGIWRRFGPGGAGTAAAGRHPLQCLEL